MKKQLKTTFVSLIVAVTLFPTAIFAQSTVTPPAQQPSTPDTANPTDTTTVPGTSTVIPGQYFDLQIEVGAQSVWTNKIPVTVTIKANSASPRTEISWSTPLGMTVEKKYDDYFSMSQGSTTTVKGVLKPTQPGTYEIAVNAIAWQYDTNFTTTSKFRLDIDESLHVTPQSGDYTTNLMIKYIVYLLIFIILIALTILGAKKGANYLKEWMRPPD